MMLVSYFCLLELLSLICFKFGEKFFYNFVEKGNFISNLFFLSFFYVFVDVDEDYGDFEDYE